MIILVHILLLDIKFGELEIYFGLLVTIGQCQWIFSNLEEAERLGHGSLGSDPTLGL